ncbi:F420-0:Gamma-glutamyl ligase [Methanobrevibacter gottschalkii]|uniref:F420-0:gamma-glutamyl ligase n=3 Tax=Methanobrevibacter gottschalkii TaxID=190974 RepID=A0A3N5AY81_9EURY|nr:MULTISPECIES: coenzyme F420-0:L-glutamate ligase [Methanobrevibacter]MCQ2970401.1 coenzyme F420-0:L-glutamate ligase [archaeon]OED01022.1 F420-0--gamma-glutamyl ligase [Methanobrevibacter sp. A27]RPF50216.1 F420-0:gamma-glutamyl ligase [Methanobrevibacter gottschalkii DSM 11977]SEL13096.1 F420-0:Gamma-glutamyl ligase [Methanobrevibacter gottschalkii]
MRCVGTVVRGIRTPIIKENDDLANIVVDSVMAAKESEGFEFKNKDIVAITEAVVGISEGNYVTVDDVAQDLQNKFPSKNIGVTNPILSRNRFSIILKGIARGMDKITLLTSFPADEVGNGILDEEVLDASEYNLASVISEEEYKKTFGSWKHPFTGINMIDLYRELIESEDCEVEFVFSNDVKTILDYNKDILTCDIHTREKTTKLLKSEGANVYGLHNVLSEPIGDSGFNPDYGVLGSNKATEEKLKLFPKTGNKLVNEIQKRLNNITGKQIEVMVYGDGAFKDPVGHIWELADPVVSPAHTSGLIGTPNEIKLKYVSDNKFANLRGEELKDAIKEEIKNKDKDLTGQMITQGTTPRRLTDLIGSLCDLTSGSGDKGTPVIFIQGYFDNLAND